MHRKEIIKTKSLKIRYIFKFILKWISLSHSIENNIMNPFANEINIKIIAYIFLFKNNVT